MRYLRILTLHFEDVLQVRSRAFVYFIINIINPLMLILFWQGAFAKQSTISGFSQTQINSYYLLLIIINTTLISHIEEKIAKSDIRSGELVRYLTRPFPYLLISFFEELPHRLIQGLYGIAAYMLLSYFITIPPVVISSASVLIIILAYLLSFIIQATISLIAFWIIDMNGILNTLEVIRVVLSGMLIPLSFLPLWMSSIAYTLPFAYFIYFPAITLLGNTTSHMQLWIIFMQVLWIAIFGCTYKLLWYFGIRKFSGVGQ